MLNTYVGFRFILMWNVNIFGTRSSHFAVTKFSKKSFSSVAYTCYLSVKSGDRGGQWSVSLWLIHLLVSKKSVKILVRWGRSLVDGHFDGKIRTSDIKLVVDEQLGKQYFKLDIKFSFITHQYYSIILYVAAKYYRTAVKQFLVMRCFIITSN